MQLFKKIFLFYYEGFKNMTVGKKLWVLILLKLFIMFAILKMFFFKDFLGTNFETDRDRGAYVLEQLSK